MSVVSITSDDDSPGPSSLDGPDAAANQLDFISFDDGEEDVDDDANTTKDMIDALDGPGPASTAQYEKSFKDRKQPYLNRRDQQQNGRDGGYGYGCMDVLHPLARPPWQPPGRIYSNNALKMLHEEIDDYVHFLVPTEAEHQMRELTVKRIERLVKRLWKDAEVRVFGSFETKLYLPTSDVDVVIICPSIPPSRTKQALTDLDRLIGQEGIARSKEFISGARVPIIKIVDGVTTFPVDISLNVPSGLDSAALVKQFLSDPVYGPGLRPLMLILKQFLLQRGMNEPFSGGMGSYALLVLVSSFLKLHPLLQMGQIRCRDNLGVLLLEALDFWGNTFNYSDVAVIGNMEEAWYVTKNQYASTRASLLARLSLPQSHHALRQSALTLVDPQDHTNELGGATRSWHQIRAEFSKMHQILQAMIGASYERQLKGERVEIVTLLGGLLTVRKEVMTVREGVQERYRTMVAEGRKVGRSGADALELFLSGGSLDGTPNPGQKRKWRDESSDEEYLYVSGSSDDDSDGDNTGRRDHTGRSNGRSNKTKEIEGRKKKGYRKLKK